MTRMKLLFLLACLLVFGAGAVIGAAAVIKRGEPNRGGPGGGPLGHLHLSPEQQKQIHAIWSDVMENQGPQLDERCRKVEKDKAQAVVDLLGPEQKTRYDQIQLDAEAKLAALGEQRGKVFRDAERRTRELLNEEQQAKYDEWQKKRSWGGNRGPGRDRDWDRRGRGPGTGPTSAPVN
jgi:Spy/CpxP family protein refolding chaperone